LDGFCDVLDADTSRAAAPVMEALATLVGRWLADVASFPGNNLKLEFLLETFDADMRTVALDRYPELRAARVCAAAPTPKEAARPGFEPESG
jgi:hypothetical protein